MSKYLKLYPPVSMNRQRETNKFVFRRSNFKMLLNRLLVILALVAVIFITIQAFYTGSVFFQNILTGLFIIGCVLFIIAMGEDKTRVTRITKNNKS